MLHQAGATSNASSRHHNPHKSAAPPPTNTLARQAELFISNVLRGGVLLSAVIICIGVIIFYYRYLTMGRHAIHVNHFPHALPGIWNSLLVGDPDAIISIGLLLLLITPVVRVFVSIIAFLIEHDWRYAIITSLVFAILLASLLTGHVATHLYALPLQPRLSFFLLVFFASLGAGLVGSLVGLGGGVFVVPLLTLVFGFPPDIAIGASIVSVIATSSAAAAAYIRDHITNLRVGMFLEIATTIGAITGALLEAIAPINLLYILFGLVLIVSVAPLLFKLGEELPANVQNDRWARMLSLGGSYPDRRLGGDVTYHVTHVPQGFAMMTIAGILSGLLGIGSGTFKVLAMDTAMRLPMKVSSTTSNFMIGVTAAASAGIYFARGDINPIIAAPVALGVLVGATLGARALTRLSNATIRKIFIPLIFAVAIEMLLKGLPF